MKLPKPNKALIVACAALVLCMNNASAQVEKNVGIDTLNTKIDETNIAINQMKKLKFTGYIQAQWQKVDTAGTPSMAAGNFAKDVNNRFGIRRGRLKAIYNNGWSEYDAQLDINDKGVGLKDIYGKFTDPWTKAFTVTTGIFDVPFGFEVPFSTSVLESPERARMMQTLLPGEADLGAMLTFNPYKTSRFNWIKLDVGAFNGTQKVQDFDSKKDMVLHLGINKANANEKIKVGFGVSHYQGGVLQQNKYVFNAGKDSAGVKMFIVDSNTTNKGKYADRKYTGVDAQIIIDEPLGLTTIRGEYIFGSQPGTASSYASPSALPSFTGIDPKTGKTDIRGTTIGNYNRNFNGAVFYFIQNIMKTKHQIFVKYDWFDPNTDVAGTEIGATGSNYKATEIKYTTLGIGYAYRWDANVRITAYYDMVKNENTLIAGKGSQIDDFRKDINDNVLTLRVQYKF